MVGENFESAPFSTGIVGAGQSCSTTNVTTPYEMLFCEKDSTWRKKRHFCVFWVFFLVSSTSAQRSQENLVESIETAATRLEKAGTRHERRCYGLWL